MILPISLSLTIAGSQLGGSCASLSGDVDISSSGETSFVTPCAASSFTILGGSQTIDVNNDMFAALVNATFQNVSFRFKAPAAFAQSLTDVSFRNVKILNVKTFASSGEKIGAYNLALVQSETVQTALINGEIHELLVYYSSVLASVRIADSTLSDSEFVNCNLTARDSPAPLFKDFVNSAFIGTFVKCTLADASTVVGDEVGCLASDAAAASLQSTHIAFRLDTSAPKTLKVGLADLGSPFFEEEVADVRLLHAGHVVQLFSVVSYEATCNPSCFENIIPTNGNASVCQQGGLCQVSDDQLSSTCLCTNPSYGGTFCDICKPGAQCSTTVQDKKGNTDTSILMLILVVAALLEVMFIIFVIVGAMSQKKFAQRVRVNRPQNNIQASLDVKQKPKREESNSQLHGASESDRGQVAMPRAKVVTKI